MKRILLITAMIGLTFSTLAQTSTNQPVVPTDTGNFAATVLGWVSSLNPQYSNTFGASTFTLWTGADSIQGGKVNLANEIGLSYNVYKSISIESVTRDSGIAGTLLSENIGVGFSKVLVDMRFTGYLDAGYDIFNEKGSKFKDNLFGEAGIRVAKALTEHTAMMIGMGAKFPSGDRVFSASVLATF